MDFLTAKELYLAKARELAQGAAGVVQSSDVFVALGWGAQEAMYFNENYPDRHILRKLEAQRALQIKGPALRKHPEKIPFGVSNYHLNVFPAEEP